MSITGQVRYSLLLIFASCVLASACNPYGGLYPGPGATVQATPSATNTFVVTLSPVPIPRPTCTVTTNVPDGYLNIRTGAGVNYAVMGTLHEGEILTIITQNTWLEVETPQHMSGWVHSKYCK